jgi:hypothetical protein
MAIPIMQPRRLIFLNINGDGKIDSKEPLTLTDDTGAFRFAGVTARGYTVRPLLPESGGWSYSITTTPDPLVVNLSKGQSVSGLTIGFRGGLVF